MRGSGKVGSSAVVVFVVVAVVVSFAAVFSGLEGSRAEAAFRSPV